MKYMVMECHPGFRVVLDENGSFIKAVNMHYEQGQTVEDIIPLDIRKKEENKPLKLKYFITAMAACLIIVITSLVSMTDKAVVSVYLTINPEVRIDINKKDEVVNLVGVNQDGKDLISGYEYKKKNIDIVMDELIDRAIEMDYLHEGGKVTLTLDGDEKWITEKGKEISDTLNETFNAAWSVTIEVEDSTHEIIVDYDEDEDDNDEDDEDD